MSYAINYADLWRRAARYVDKILQGMKPGELPVGQPTSMARGTIMSENLHKTRPEKKEVTVGASRCLCCQIQPIPSPDLDPAGTSGRSPRRDVLARDFARDHCVGCGGGDRGGEMLMHS